MTKKEKLERKDFLMFSMSAAGTLRPSVLAFIKKDVEEALEKCEDTSLVNEEEELLKQSEVVLESFIDWAGMDVVLRAMSNTLHSVAKDLHKDARSFVKKDENTLLQDARLLSAIATLLDVYVKG